MLKKKLGGAKAPLTNNKALPLLDSDLSESMQENKSGGFCSNPLTGQPEIQTSAAMADQCFTYSSVMVNPPGLQLSLSLMTCNSSSFGACNSLVKFDLP